MINGVIANKLQTLDEVLNELRSLGTVDATMMKANWMTQRAIDRCIQLGVLSSSEQYVQMVRFRNFIVHRYDRIDAAVLADVLNNHMKTFETFRDEVLAYVKAN